MTNGHEGAIERQVRLLIMREHEYLVAQCLEYDIAVQGRTPDEVIQRFQDTFTDVVILANEYGDQPLSNLGPAPQTYEHLWNNASKLGMLKATLDLKLSVVTDHPLPQTAVMAIS